MLIQLTERARLPGGPAPASCSAPCWRSMRDPGSPVSVACRCLHWPERIGVVVRLLLKDRVFHEHVSPDGRACARPFRGESHCRISHPRPRGGGWGCSRNSRRTPCVACQIGARHCPWRSPAPAAERRPGAGELCRQAAMPNGRCRMHGGSSTGPTAVGIERIRQARTIHGGRSAEMIELRREMAILRRAASAVSRSYCRV